MGAHISEQWQPAPLVNSETCSMPRVDSYKGNEMAASLLDFRIPCQLVKSVQFPLARLKANGNLRYRE